jgi:cell division protein FtsI (penicillin-binding protein 3)
LLDDAWPELELAVASRAAGRRVGEPASSGRARSSSQAAAPPRPMARGSVPPAFAPKTPKATKQSEQAARAARAAGQSAPGARSQPSGGQSTRRQRGGRNATARQRRTNGDTRSNRPAPSLWKAGRPKVRLVSMLVVCSLGFAAIVGRIALLQTTERSTYAAYGAKQRQDTVKLPAERGSILDRTHTELALSVPQSTIWADPRAVLDKEVTAAQLAAVLHLDAAAQGTLLASLARDAQFVYVARQVDDVTADAVAALKLPGIYRLEEPKRFNPDGELARSIVGTTDPDGKGTSGLELQYENLLTGTPGALQRESDQQGRTIPNGRSHLVAAVPGQDVVLTLDSALQYTVEQRLAVHVQAVHAKGGTVVIMETATGNIRAMASVETDTKTGRVTSSAASKALVDVYEPGSVAKIVPAAAALNEGASDLGTSWHIKGSQSYGPDETVINDVETYNAADLTLPQIIARSSNNGAVALSAALGPERMEKYLHAFGFGEDPGLGFPHESAGLLPPASKWYGSQKQTIAYGQGISVSAVQLVAAMNTIANGGLYVSPRLVSSTIGNDGAEVAAPAAPTRQVLTPGAAAQMNAVLQGVVCNTEYHTAPKAAVDGYTVAGKTGTGFKAQNLGVKVKRPSDGRIVVDNYLDLKGQHHYSASFAGFLPAEQPAFTILVTIDEPPADGDHYGGSVAAPLFSELAKEAIRILGVPPSPNWQGCAEYKYGG